MMETLDLQPPQTDLPEHLHRTSPEKARADVSVGVRERTIKNFMPLQRVDCMVVIWTALVKFDSCDKIIFKWFWIYLQNDFCKFI